MFCGVILLLAFAFWTMLIQVVDVKPIGLRESDVGFAALNTWFHERTGVHMSLYTITDWLGLVPIFVCLVFGLLGFLQLVKRRSLFKVDYDILVLGMYYVLVIFGYLIFEMIPINYRPIFINGYMEASYPSSTTLLVLSVMPTLNLQVRRRIKKENIRKIIQGFSVCFPIFFYIFLYFNRYIQALVKYRFEIQFFPLHLSVHLRFQAIL